VTGNLAARSRAKNVLATEEQRAVRAEGLLTSLRQACWRQAAQTQQKLAALSHDLGLADNLQSVASQCADEGDSSAAAAPSAALLRSSTRVGLQHRRHSDLRGAGADSTDGVRASHEGGKSQHQLEEQDRRANATLAALLRQGETQLRSREARALFRAALQDEAGASPCAPGMQEAGQGPWPDGAGKNFACKMEALSGPRRCGVFAARLRQNFERLKVQISAARHSQDEADKSCRDQDQLLETQLRDSERKRAVAREQLGDARDELQPLEGTRDSRSWQLDTLVDNQEDSADVCSTGIAKLKAEIQDAIRLRSAFSERIRDCKVSEWSVRVCSQQCTPPGGTPGQREVVRRQLMPGSAHGRECPPLKARFACGLDPCPQDCIMGAWSSWSGCSAKCGGGIQSRMRPAERLPSHGGLGCTGVLQSRVCNVGSCNPECVLADWSPWTGCSRACRFSEATAAGRRERVRAVAQPAGGSGSCPSEKGVERLQEEKCNEALCHAKATCQGARAGSQQVFVLLDGSEAANLQAQVNVLRGIVTNASESMSFGVAVYGAQVRFLSQLTTDRAALLHTLEGVAPAGGSPDLVKAEAFALNVIQTNRGGSLRGVASAAAAAGGTTLLVFADAGLAVLEPATVQAQRLRALNVRVLFGVVEDGAAATRNGACRLAGDPCKMNLEVAPRWQELTASPLRFLAALCDKLKAPPPAHFGPGHLASQLV